MPYAFMLTHADGQVLDIETTDTGTQRKRVNIENIRNSNINIKSIKQQQQHLKRLEVLAARPGSRQQEVKPEM
jgi:hypothetical protein